MAPLVRTGGSRHTGLAAPPHRNIQVFQLTKRIDFLESLISELKGVKYLRHVKRIRDRIEMWKSTIKEEELRAICRKLYQ